MFAVAPGSEHPIKSAPSRLCLPHTTQPQVCRVCCHRLSSGFHIFPLHPSETYVVVGIWSIEDTEEGARYNEFGTLFAAAGERVSARRRMTGFDSSGWFGLSFPSFPCVDVLVLVRTVMEVKSDDMLKFIGGLQASLARAFL